MNPSANGWIDKFGFIVQSEPPLYNDYQSLYEALKTFGFVYGINTGIPNFINTQHSLSEDEMAKVNLLTALYGTYKIESKKKLIKIVVNFNR